jgi:NAD(P)-dependent dehydrogenase (short-subunit alcohol dehydrogenase family)
MSAERGPAMLQPGDRVIMISGANRGIGLAIARRLHGDGYRLSLGARDVDALTRATKSFATERVLRCRFDALQPAHAEAWLTATLERFGRLDGLVNNAGILRQVTFESGTEAELDELFAVNVKAPYRLIRLCLPHLKRAGHGRIVNIGSTDAKRYRESVPVGYAMSKHALNALSHAAKFAGWADGVRVTLLCPGATDTDMIANAPGVTPAAQRIDPDTIAATVSFLMSAPNNATIAEIVVNSRLESTI